MPLAPTLREGTTAHVNMVIMEMASSAIVILIVIPILFSNENNFFQILMNVLKELIHVIVMLNVWILMAATIVCVIRDLLEVEAIVQVG